MFAFEQELMFFELGEDVVKQLHADEGILPTDEAEDSQPSTHDTSNWQSKMWLFFEDPASSIGARIASIASMLVIGFSITVFCLETLPGMKSNDTEGSNAEPWFTFELCSITWFSLEYTARLISSPSKFHFIFSILNTVDLLAILPYFVILAIRSGGNTAPLSILRVIRLVRVFRIFKLSRHSMSLQVLGNTLQASVKELGMLIFFLAMGVICFSSAIYYAEEGMTDTFSSIPDAFWYSLVTMTTVGYGDKTPTTLAGKLIGGFCALTGVLTLALPVPVIASNFEFFYKQGVLMSEKKKKREQEMEEREESPI